MKTLKKLLTVIVLCLVAVFGLTACKGKHKNKGDSSSNTTGVYYLYENDTYNKSDYYELLSGNKWKDNDGEKGTYSVSSGTITFYYTFDGETEELFNGTISDGVMCLDIFGEATYYCKDGKTPSGNNGSGGNDGGQTETQHTVTYNANGGAFASGETTLTSKAKDNSTLTAPDSPIRTNYTFAGWAKNSSGSEKWNFSTDKVTGNLTLYATWSQESATILSVDGASIDGLKIFMFVDKDTDSVSLASKVVCSDDSVWKLYYDKLGQTEIPTKIAADISGELLDGDNVFYIVVTSQDGVHVNVYELNVYRSYAIDVCYYDGDNLLKTVTAYTGYEFMPNYTPTITGYTFNDWNYTPEILWDDLELYADKTANTYTVTYDVNGGDELTTTEKTVTYGSSYTFVKPTKTGYTFLGWYYGETQLTDGNGKSLAVWNYAKNLTVKATWERTDLLNFTYMKSTSGITITGVKDKTVTTLIVPEDVIKISAGAFNGCSSLTSITLPFIGGSVSATSASSSTLFGYIFGTSSYTGGTETEQYYDWNGPLDSTYYIPSNLKSVTITGGKLLLGAFYG
ncbi:MAG: InlB B-repeat-containing protein, partial [Clostridia bacterium]|nr:InlB B-repeat-containing protein [Clostridia bacterium]